MKISDLYQNSLALLTDLYQLTMAYGYWKMGRTEDQAIFNMFFRKAPFDGGYTIACGLEYVLDFVNHLRFHDEDIAYLSQLKGNDNQPLFEKAFFDYLQTMSFNLDIDAIPEGTIVFPQEPVVRVKGPLIQCQLIETALLNMINFQTLIATKSARICQAARGEPVLEFGLRRAQGIDGSLAASRAAYIGGSAATSNVLAGKLFGIPVKGTHAHSWVMCFDSEEQAFDAYAEAMPNNCVFLVDTYDTLDGVKNAIETGKKLRSRGFEMLGIRLDSGDLEYLSCQARQMLDEAGFQKAFIVASNDLDEYLIDSLKQQEAAINVWGVGTRLVTAYDQPALGGVYKLVAIQRPKQDWEYKIKISEQSIKTTIPGCLNVRRYIRDSQFIADMIYDERLGISENPVIADPGDSLRRKKIEPHTGHEDLLIPVMRQGKCVYKTPKIHEIRKRTQQQLASVHKGVKRPINPHQYPAGIELGLCEMRNRMILETRQLV